MPQPSPSPTTRDTPLLRLADVAILLETPPELIAGSTRMGAGTAQKIALNMLSTLTAVHLGHVHDGYMVNLMADNIKLRDRAARIVAAIAGCSRDDAAKLLETSGGAVKTADSARRRRRRRRCGREAYWKGPARSCDRPFPRSRGARGAMLLFSKPNLKKVNRETEHDNETTDGTSSRHQHSRLRRGGLCRRT